MKLIINLFCILFALAFIVSGIYLGIFTMLIGGIINIIDGAKMTPVDGHLIAIGVVKAIFFEIPIGVGFMFGILCFKACKA